MLEPAPAAKTSVFLRVTTAAPGAVPQALATALRRRPDLPRQESTVAA